jgi:hypothetical protein
LTHPRPTLFKKRSFGKTEVFWKTFGWNNVNDSEEKEERTNSG